MRIARKSAAAGAVVVWVVVLLVAMGGPVRAGGSFLNWDRMAYEPGDVAVATGSFGDGCCDRGTPKDGPFFVYLYSGDYWTDPPVLPEDAMRVAELEVEAGSSFHAARIEFVVPDLPPGTYHVTHCNDPCTKLLGDIINPDIQIVESDVEARTVARLTRMKHRFEALAYPLQGLRPRINRLTLRVKSLEGQIETMSGEIADLKQQAQAASREEERDGVDPAALAGFGLVAGVLAAALVRRPHRWSKEDRAL